MFGSWVEFGGVGGSDDAHVCRQHRGAGLGHFVYVDNVTSGAEWTRPPLRVEPHRDGDETVAWVLIGVSAVLLTGLGALVLRWGSRLEPLNRMLDLMAVFLTLMALTPIVLSGLRPMTMKLSRDWKDSVETPLGYLPDIYLIVLDGFGRADLLKEIYEVDLGDLQTH